MQINEIFWMSELLHIVAIGKITYVNGVKAIIQIYDDR